MAKKNRQAAIDSSREDKAARPNMRDLARLAGVSVGTVSLALKGSPLCSDKTRDKIQAMALKLGYRKDPYVSALMEARRGRKATPISPLLGFLTFHDTADGWKEAPYIDNFTPAAAEAERLGFRLERFWARDPAISPRRLRQILLARGIRGLILNPPPRRELTFQMDWSDFSLVTVGSGLRDPVTHRVAADHFDNARRAVRRCVEFGFRRIGLICREEADRRLQRRWSGAYYGELAAHQLPIDLPPFKADTFTAEDVAGWLREVQPEAVVGTLNTSILQPLRRRRLLGVRQCPYIGISLKSNEWISGFVEPLDLAATTAVKILAGMIHRSEHGIPELASETFLLGRWNNGKTFNNFK